MDYKSQCFSKASECYSALKTSVSALRLAGENWRVLESYCISQNRTFFLPAVLHEVALKQHFNTLEQAFSPCLPKR